MSNRANVVSSRSWKTARAPGRLPLLGHILGLRKGLLNFVASLPAYGDLVEIRLGSLPVYVVCHPDLTHHVFLADRTFDRGGPVIDKGREVLGNSLITSLFQDHRQQRKMLQPAFRTEYLRSYSQVMTRHIAEVTNEWHDGQTIDALAHMHAITSRVVASTLFTASSANESAAVIAAESENILRGIYTYLLMPSKLHWLPIPSSIRFSKARDRVHAAVRRTMQEYRRDAGHHNDLLSTLMDARKDDGRPLTDSEIQDQVLVFLIGGIETTAAALGWALYLLSKHPDVQRQLYTEVDDVLAGRTATWDDLPHLKATQRVITETLRLYPPVWMNTRITTTDTELAGIPLPVGTPLIVSPYLIHHRSDAYHDPERFDPDRWLNDSSRPSNTCLPFGVGPRKCIGDEFGMAEATLALSSIAARWRLEPVSEKPVLPAPRFTLTPKNLTMRVSERIPVGAVSARKG